MARRSGVMSDALKMELAEELGFADTVRKEGWGAISTRDAGNLVKLAVKRAEIELAQSYRQQPLQ